MKLSDQAKKDLLDFSTTDEFQRMEKRIFAENPGTPQATNQFTDFLQFLHNMAGHPIRPPKPMKGDLGVRSQLLTGEDRANEKN